MEQPSTQQSSARTKATRSKRSGKKAKPSTTPKGLNAQEQRFVDEYLVDLDAHRAAIAAGYSKTVAKTKAYCWVSRGKEKPHVYAAVLADMEKRSRRTAITQDRVLEELGRLAFSDIRKLYREDGTVKLPHELDDDTAAAVQSMETLEEFEHTHGGREEQGHGGALKRGGRTLIGYARKFKLHSKEASLRLAMQHLGMLKDKLEVDLSGRIAYDVNFGTPDGK